MIRLLNRRFVPFHFDMFGGHAADAAAHAAIGKQRPALARGSIGDNPILFLKPDGTIMAEILATAATTDGLLAKLEEVLRKHPEYGKPAPAEAALEDPLARAELLIDLRRDEDADRLLSAVDTPRAHYLRGRLARFRGDFAAMQQHFDCLAAAPEFAASVRMESAYALWHGKKQDELAAHLNGFPDDSARCSEARYYEGLGLYHSGRRDEARALWKATILSRPQDGWIYRMDWAYADSAQDFGVRSPLGRIGYMGAYRNQDLARQHAMPKK